jgi:hypothetical protein
MRKDTWGIVEYLYSTSVIRTTPVLHFYLLQQPSAPQPPAVILNSIKDDQELRRSQPVGEY